MKTGDKVICISDFENRWGSCDQIAGNLVVGQEYTVAEVELHSWHTKIQLEEKPGKRFNDVHFEVQEEAQPCQP